MSTPNPEVNQLISLDELEAKPQYKAIKILGTVLGAMTVVLTTAFTLDARYVHAEDLREQSIVQQRQVTELHASFLDDKIFELELRKANKPKEWTATDQLVLDRYKAKMDMLNNVKQQQAQTLKSISQDQQKK